MNTSAMQEAVKLTLAHIEAQARLSEGYETLLAVPELPGAALNELGTLTRLDDPSHPNALPSVLLEKDGKQAQIELCPFGPLVLITSDGDLNTDPLAQALLDAEITPLFPGDLDAAQPWHGSSLADWLFPRRVTDALALVDDLRSRG